MTVTSLETFREGTELLGPLLRANGFTYREGRCGRSSGGEFASGKYVKDDRILEIHFRYSLGLVTYHIGSESIRHEVFMRALLGQEGDNRYPGFASDPLDGFRALRYDLENFASDFLKGTGEQFRRCVNEALAARKLSAFERMGQGWPNSLEETLIPMERRAGNRSSLVGIAIGIVLFHFALNIAHRIAHGRLAIGLDAFQKIFVVAIILVAPLIAAFLIWKRRLRAGGALLAISMAGALVFGVYFHFILPGPDHVTHIRLPLSFDMRDIFDVTAVLLALFEALGLLAGVRIFSKS
jgi:hypothetical protein